MTDLPLIIRADAGTKMGSGHLMRCIALGQAWQRYGGHVHFITACDNQALLNRLQNANFTVVRLPKQHPSPIDWEITCSILGQNQAAPVVVDGYHFDLNYQEKIRLQGHLLLVVDDFAHNKKLAPDILLNQNINANELDYALPENSTLLFGTKYALLRSEFIEWQGKQRPFSPSSQNILVTLGGSDPENQTEKVIDGLVKLRANHSNFPDLNVVIVVGATNPHLAQLQSRIESLSFPIELVQNATNMPELMNWADIGICAGGSTCWEFAFMGVPMIINVIAENQVAIATGLEKVNGAMNLGWYDYITPVMIAHALADLLKNTVKRQAMEKKLHELVDGEGSNRVVSHLNRVWKRRNADRLFCK